MKLHLHNKFYNIDFEGDINMETHVDGRGAVARRIIDKIKFNVDDDELQSELQKLFDRETRINKAEMDYDFMINEYRKMFYLSGEITDCDVYEKITLESVSLISFDNDEAVFYVRGNVWWF